MLSYKGGVNATHMLFSRLLGRYRRSSARTFCRRPFRISLNEPLVSFTFDDFPRSALFTAGDILKDRGLAGTYYASLGLAGGVSPTGEIFHLEDLHLLLASAHELGCHTFNHCNASETPAAIFERSILENSQALKTFLPLARFSTLSYPIGPPRPATKRRCAWHFTACRSGGQRFNHGTIDLNLLSSFFIEQSRDHWKEIMQVIQANSAAAGWLIFSTHDVCDQPTRYGCEPRLFEQIVNECLHSGARILPVSAALAACGVPLSRPADLSLTQ